MVTYFVILYIFSIGMSLYYAGRGGVHHTPGELVFAAIWAGVNLWLLLTFGFPAVL